MNIYSNNAYERYLKALQNNDTNALAALQLEFARREILEKREKEKMIDEIVDRVMKRISVEIQKTAIDELRKMFNDLFNGRGN